MMVISQVPSGRAAGSVASYGNMGKMPFRVPGYNNLDFSLVKLTPIWESVSLEFRAESFNVFNRVQFGPPGQVFTANSNSTLGAIFSQANNPRLIQFGLRLNF